MDIRDRINQVLAERGMSPRAASLAAGLSDSFLSKFLHPDKAGGIKSMTLDTCTQLAEALGVSPRWLAFGDGPKVPEPKIVYLWDKIAERHKARAMRVLESFVEGDEESEAG